MSSDENVLKNLAERYGGAPHPPSIRTTQVRKAEVIEVTVPLRSREAEYFRLDNMPTNWVAATELATPIPIERARATTRTYAYNYWVTKRHEYDPETCVLTLFGYYQTYRFHVWTLDADRSR